MNKKASATNIIALLIVIVVFILIITLSIIASHNQDIERNKVCNKIGDNAGLDFLFQSLGRCGSGEDCSYQCKFVDSNGDIIIKNVN